MASKEAKQKFESIFSEFVADILEAVKSTGCSQNAIDWVQKNIKHNAYGGKMNRGMSVVDSYRLLLNKDELSSEEYKRSACLGWCVELLQAYFLVADDIMDGSITRRDQPCWYRKEDVGMIAINDAFILESTIYILLKKYFKTDSYYVDLIELFHEVTFQTEMGQMLDLLTAPEDKVDLNNFSMDKYTYIITYKTAFYSFYLPVALAMYMAGVSDEADLKQARDMLIPLGQYFQIQDDYLDCFGDPNVIGKIGTDIQDNKCGWVINKALKIATPEQRSVLDDNYGRKNADNESKVKEIFKNMKLDQMYLDLEEELVADLRKKIAAVDESRGFKGEVIETFLKKIYKRQK